MPTTTIKRNRRTTASRNIRENFTHWFGLKSEADLISKRQADVRVDLLTAIEEYGEADENGSSWFEFDEPVVVTDGEGRTLQFSFLKRERHLTPANPLPEPELAEELLRKRKLWLSKSDERLINVVQQENPYVTITVAVDVDALAKAVLTGAISDEEYEATLTEQRESWQFRPLDRH